MGIPAAAVSAIASGAAQIGQNALNAIATGKSNRKQRKWAEKMYTQQREDSYIMWDKQNAYNSPAAQMQRYKEAKLNPNLIYGQTNEAAPIKSADAPSWNPRAPEFNLDAAPVLSAYYDTQIKQANIDNLAKQGAVLDQDALLKKAQIDNVLAQTGNTLANTDSTRFDLSLKSQLEQNSLDMAAAKLRQTLVDTQYTLNNDERQEAMNSSNLREAVERILKSRAERTKIEAEKHAIYAQIRNLHLDESLKFNDLRLRNIGLNPSDPTWMRVLAEQLDKVMNKVKGTDGSALWDNIKTKFSNHNKRAAQNLGKIMDYIAH